MTQTLAYVEDGVDTIIHAQPTALLRWLGDVLQQSWQITTVRGADPPRVAAEWRDVAVEIVEQLVEMEVG